MCPAPRLRVTAPRRETHTAAPPPSAHRRRSGRPTPPRPRCARSGIELLVFFIDVVRKDKADPLRRPGTGAADRRDLLSSLSDEHYKAVEASQPRRAATLI
ncbi:hypothetical protein O3P69_010340 [Scylla paramamosain]|uniref:Uncharacterized protein n=1 Tax=Scylla paramamosain TaxID=85552 RepID=A0AAW0TVE8_SCYPA